VGTWSFLLASNTSAGGSGGGLNAAGGNANFAGGGGGGHSNLTTAFSGGSSLFTYSYAVLTADAAGGRGGSGLTPYLSYSIVNPPVAPGGGGGAGTSTFPGTLSPFGGHIDGHTGCTGAIRFAFIPVVPA
jgi:hypothetical protein